MKSPLCLLFLLVSSSVFSQVSGYQGRRFIVKVDLAAAALDGAFHIGAEYAFSRRFTLGISLINSDKDYKEKNTPYFLRHGFYPSQKANVRDFQVGAECRFYHNSVVPAPKGSYTFLQYYYGRALVRGHEYTYSNVNPQLDKELEYTFSNVRTSKLALGFGYQEVLFDRMTLDFGLGLTFGTLNAKDDQLNQTMDNFAYRYGPNLLKLGQWQASQPGGFGLSISLKIGILLF